MTAFNHTGKRSPNNAQRPSLVYIFAGNYDIAAKVAQREGLGRIRWQFIASRYTIIGRAYLRLWVVPDHLDQHPQYRSVTGALSEMRAAGKLVEDESVPGPESQ